MKLSQLVGRLGRPLWFPLAFRFGLKVEQIPWDEAAGDPATLAYVLRSVHRLLLSDAVVGVVDVALLAEACGARVARDRWGRVVSLTVPAEPADPKGIAVRGVMGAALETTARLCEEAGGRTPVVACVTGPGTLGRQLFGTHPLSRDQMDYLGAAMGTVTRAYAEAGVRAVVVMEERSADAGLALESRCLDTAAHLASFYAVPLLLLCGQGLDPQARELARQRGFAYVAGSNVLTVPVSRVAPGELERWSAADTARPEAELARTALGASLAYSVVTTSWEIPVEAHPDLWTRLAAELTSGG